MSSRAEPAPRHREVPLSVAFGGWAAAVAIAPSAAAKAAIAAPAVVLPAVWWMLGRHGRWLSVFFAAALLLPPLPAPIGDSGPHPSLAIAVAGVFAGLVWLRDWRVPATAPAGPLAGFFAALLASVAQAALRSGAEPAAGSLARVALFGIAVYVFFYTRSTPAGEGEHRADTRRLYWMAVAAALFACVDFYFQFPAPAGYGQQFVWLDTGVYRRAQGLFYEASTLGNFCVFFLVMIAVSLARPRALAPVSRKGLAAGGLVFAAALALSYSRGSVVSLAVALAALLLLNLKRVRWARLTFALASLGGAAAWITWKIFPRFVEMYWLRLSATAQFFFSSTEGVLSGRVASWRTLVDWLSAHPGQAMFGVGYKTLPYTNYLGMPVIADNMYLSILVETGVVGLAALLWLNVSILRAGWRARASFFGAWILCFWAGETVQMLSGDLLTYWRVLPVYFWVLALATRA